MKDNAVYIRGSIGGTMLKTGVSMLAGTLAMSGYNIIDTYFVGKLPGAAPLAAMGFAFPVCMLVVCVFRGLCIGAMTTTAQALGAAKKKKAATMASAGAALTAVFSIAIGALGFMTSGPVFQLFGASGESLEQVKGFMDIWFLGCFTASLSMFGNDLLIAAGDSKAASAMMMAGMLLNALIDPAFIFGAGPLPGMGIRGAALATVLSQCASMCAVMAILNKRHGLLKFERIPWRKLRGSWLANIRFGIPSTIGMLMMPAGMAVVTRATASFGDVAVAAAAAATRLEMVPFVFPMALGMSMTPMVGQNFGARLYSRIEICRRFSARFAFGFLTVMAAVYFVSADFLSRQFSSDPEVQKILALCLRIIPWGFATIEIHRYSGFVFTGCGRPAVAAWLNAMRIGALLIPLTLLALLARSLEGIFFARLTADLLAGSIAFLLARRMTRALPADGMPQPQTNRRGSWLGELLEPAFSMAAWGWAATRSVKVRASRIWTGRRS